MLTRPSPESSPEAPRESSAGRPAGTSAGPFALWSVVRTKRLPDFVWVYGLLVLAIVAMGIVSPGTLSFRHLMDLTRQAAPLGVVATGQTLLLMCGHIDLSYGAQITLCNVVLSTVMKTAEDSRILPAVLAAVSVAMVVGLGNGLAITKLRIPPFVATLAMALLIEGSYLIYTGGSPSGNISEGFRVIAEGWLGGVFPWATVIWIMISAFIALLINRGRLGSEILAVGGNPQASHLSGLAVHRSVISVYVIGSVLAAFSGCLISAYIGLASIGVGGPYTLNSVASTVIGGTPFSGGEGTVAGTFGGALIMIILNAILTTLNTGEAGKLVVQGMTIILMVGIYQRRAREQR